MRRRFISPESEGPSAEQVEPNHSAEKTSALCVFLAVRGQQSTAGWLWAERFKSRAFLDDMARTPIPPPAGVAEETLSRERELLHTLNGSSSINVKIRAADELTSLYGRWAAEGIGEEYRALRLGEPVPWATIRQLLGADM